MPKTKYDVVVVGTGIGGSACGALLARAGLKTLILEKNDKIGGICSYYEKKGFHCDVGTHTFSRGNNGPLGEVTRRLGVPGAIQFIKASPPRIKGLGFDLTMPKSILGMPGFMFQMIKQFDMDMSDAPNLFKFIRLFNSSSDELIEEWDHRSMEEFVFQYTKNPKFLAYISLMMGLCFVLPFWDSSAGESLFCNKAARQSRSLGYPKGGAYAIPKAYITAGEHFGAEVLTNAKVSKIQIKNGSVAAVETADGRSFETRAVVSTTSLKDTVLKLTGRRHFPAEFVKMVEDLTISVCGVQAKIALDRPVLDSTTIFGFGVTDKSLDVRNLSHADVYGMFEDLMAGRLPRIITLYCPIPTNFDPSLGPRGKQLLTLCAGAPTTDIKLKDPYPKWIDAMVDTFQDEFPEIKNHIEWIDTFDIKFVENWIGKMYGPAISTGQTPGQVTDKRPSVRSPIRGLYFAGDCAGGRGIGTELAADSGIECADTVVSDNILHLF